MSGSHASPGRHGPFCWQEHRAVELVHARWAGRGRATALAIYTTLSYLASVRHRDGGRDGFPATRAEIAEKAGSKPATVDAYARGLQELGLLTVERRRDATGRDVASRWTLRTPTAPGVPEEEPISLEAGVPEERHRWDPEQAPMPEEAHRGSPSGAEREPPTRARRTGDQEARKLRPSPSSVAGRAGGHEGGEGTLDLLVEEVWGILSRSIEWIDGSWPPPKRETIRQALTQDQPEPGLARNLAYEVRQIVQGQNRAPNIAGLYRKKLAEAIAERPKVRELIHDSLASTGDTA